MNPLPAWLRRLWSAWDIRVMVLWSLISQIVLIFLGARRMNTRGILIEVVVWSVYLMADVVAVFALGRLSDVSTHEDSIGKNNVPENSLMALWAPLLLLHLGGPDTITAYAVEDVRLWLRNVLGVLVHASLVIYVFLGFWTGNFFWLTILAFPLFIAGSIKYGERSWVLWCTNGFYPQAYLPIRIDNGHDIVGHLREDASLDAMMLVLSYLWLQALGPCLAQTGRFDERLLSYEVTKTLWDTSEGFFKFFELQLGFMYDALYTKASNIYTRGGYVIRVISSICVVSALLGFIIMSKDEYSSTDVYITYILLVGGAALEIYAIVLVIYSRLAIVWMSKHGEKPLLRWMLRYLAPMVVSHRKRWAGSIPQFDLLNALLYAENLTMVHWIPKYFEMDLKFIRFMCRKEEYNLKGVKALILKEVKELLRYFTADDTWGKLFSKWGEHALRRLQVDDDAPLWTIFESDFELSIVIWHIVTIYCYYLDDKPKNRLCETSKIMSNYMMHLLVNQHDVLGSGKTCDLSSLLGCYGESMEYIRKKGLSHDKAEVCRIMIDWEPDVCTCTRARFAPLSPIEYGKVPPDASELAKILMGDEYKDNKWEIISQVWAEMMCYGASKCPLTTHLQQLRRGGELLSQVWLILVIHGLIYPTPYVPYDVLRPLFADTFLRMEDTSSEIV